MDSNYIMALTLFSLIFCSSFKFFVNTIIIIIGLNKFYTLEKGANYI